MDLFGLSGKTAVVIGGTGTLGGPSRTLSRERGLTSSSPVANAEQGAAAVSRLKAAGGSAEYVAADATVKSDLEGLVAHLRTTSGTATAGERSWNQLTDSCFWRSRTRSGIGFST